MIGPEWNQEKMIIFARWIMVLTVIASLFFFQSDNPEALGDMSSLLKLAIGALLGTIMLTMLFQRLRIDQYHLICWVFDLTIVSLLIKFTGGAFTLSPEGSAAVSANLFVFFMPLLVLSNSVNKPWFLSLGSAIVINGILAYLFTLPAGIQNVPWSMYAIIAIMNFAIGAFFLFSEQWIVVGDTEEALKKQKELDKAYQNLRKEVAQRQKREQELFDKTRKLATVIQVSRILGSSMHLGDLFNVIIEKAREEMNSQMAFVMLVKNNKLEIMQSIGVSDITKELFNTEIAPGQGLLADIVLSTKSFRLNSQDHEDLLSSFTGATEKIRTLLVVPLRAPKDETPLGAVGVANLLVGQEYTEEHEDFLGIFAIEAAMFIKQLKLREDLERSYFELIISLAQAIEAKDPYTRGHVNRVANYAVRLAKALRLPNSEVARVEKAAILHDVGKIATPEHILNKPGRLTDEEFAIMKDHVVESRKLLSEITSSIDEKIKAYVAYHHERWDGFGYPQGLKAEEIPLGAQIIAVADTFDAMTSDRPYRKGFSFEEALTRLIDSAGTQFNPKVLHTFYDLMGYDVNTKKLSSAVLETIEISHSSSLLTAHKD